eukprot:PITA_07704
MVEGQQFPTYMIVPLNDVQLRSSRVLEKTSINVQEQDTSKEDSLKVNKGSEEASLQNQNIQKEKEKESTPTTPMVEQPASSSTSPFPERLQIDKGVEKQILLPDSTKKFNLYHPAKEITERGDNEWIDDEDTIQPVCTISEINEDIQILNTLENFETSSEYEHTQFQLDSDIEYLSSRQMSLYSMEEFGSSTIKVFLGKTLNINKNLEKSQQEELTKILQKHSTAFAWEYTDMKGIDPKTCIHHIYIEENSRPIRQPQRRMNPNLREIVKEEVQKLLNVNFIYPISDSRWVSPLVIVPKKNGKWRVCIDYRELNKATLKDHFPLPCIDQVLDTLAGKKYFSFLDGFSGYNQIQVAPEDQDKTTFTCPWGTFAYRVLPFGLCNAPTTFQRAVLGIFSDLIHDCVEVYMDDFTVYGDSFEEALENLEKVLIRCKETNLSLSHEKCFMMFTEGIILGHHISGDGIKVDRSKVEVISKLPIPKFQKDVRSFLGFTGYYRRFIENFTKIASHSSNCLQRL